MIGNLERTFLKRNEILKTVSESFARASGNLNHAGKVRKEALEKLVEAIKEESEPCNVCGRKPLLWQVDPGWVLKCGCIREVVHGETAEATLKQWNEHQLSSFQEILNEQR